MSDGMAWSHNQGFYSFGIQFPYVDILVQWGRRVDVFVETVQIGEEGDVSSGCIVVFSFHILNILKYFGWG